MRRRIKCCHSVTPAGEELKEVVLKKWGEIVGVKFTSLIGHLSIMALTKVANVSPAGKLPLSANVHQHLGLLFHGTSSLK